MIYHLQEGVEQYSSVVSKPKAADAAVLGSNTVATSCHDDLSIKKLYQISDEKTSKCASSYCMYKSVKLHI